MSISELVDNNTRKHTNPPRYLLKIRLPHSQLKHGKSNGFRLIAFADTELDTLCLLYVYPKRGALGFGDEDIGDNYLAELLEEYLDERDQNLLVKLDLDNDLAEIEDPPATDNAEVVNEVENTD